MVNIQIIYTGQWPCLCHGVLIVTVNGVEYEFPDGAMRPGGSVFFDDDYCEHVTVAPWRVYAWPDNFPENMKRRVVCAINRNVPWGCCGGCV